MQEKIKQLFAGMLQESPESLLAEATPDDIRKWDSMQHLIVVASVEEEFGIDIDPDEIVAMYENYGAFETMILKKVNGS